MANRNTEERRQHLKAIGFQKGTRRHPNSGRHKIPPHIQQMLLTATIKMQCPIFQLAMAQRDYQANAHKREARRILYLILKEAKNG